MTDAYRTILGAAGYHELALGFRLGIFGEWEETELPLAELSLEELRERTENFWSLVRQPQERESGLFEVQERLKLTDRELYLVFLSSLWWLSPDFGPLLERMRTAGAGLDAGTVGALMEAVHGPSDGKAANTGRMERFALLNLDEAAAGGQGRLSLDRVMADHFAAGEIAPLWWSMGTEWFRWGEKTEETVGLDRRELAVRLAEYLKAGNGLLFLDGEPGSGRRFLAGQAAGMLGRNLLFVRLTPELLAQKNAPSIIVREALLGCGWPAAVCTPEGRYGERHSFLQELEYRCRREGLPLIVIGEQEGDGENAEQEGSRKTGQDRGNRGFAVRLPGLDHRERLRMWQIMSSRLKLAEDVSLEELADRYELLPGQIQSIVALAENQARFEQRSHVDRNLLFSCCHRCLKQDLGNKAVSVPVRFSWEDLLLEKKQKDKLVRAENQIRYGYQVFEEWGLKEKQPYGHGLSLVFSGPPGTGKTMAAQVLAGRIGMELYRVELPAVVSKYIGETEKNLNEIFEHARKAQVVLFFDEADVLFGKRTDVRDSNDKYSNMEAAFLLQKMENYSGVTILATNFLRNMDEAFKRRMRYLVEFPFPDRHWRLEIWKRAFPPRLPVKPDIDVEFMAAAFELSGAGIRNVVMEAAFLSAAEKEELGMPQLIRAARGELEKNGKTMAPEEFGPYTMYLDAEEHYV